MRIAFIVGLILGLLYCSSRVNSRKAYRDGFDAMLKQLGELTIGNTSQWVLIKYHYRYSVVDPNGVDLNERVYTNRFFTNWTLTVREP